MDHADLRQHDMHSFVTQPNSFKLVVVCCLGSQTQGKRHSDDQPKLWELPAHITYPQLRQSLAEFSGCADWLNSYITACRGSANAHPNVTSQDAAHP